MNWESGKGDLYVEGKEIDYDIYMYDSGISVLSDNSVVYYTDWNYDVARGTLKIFNKGEKTKIADDVHSFIVTEDENVVYLNDYSTNYYTGTLYLYHNGESRRLEDDVSPSSPL